MADEDAKIAAEIAAKYPVMTAAASVGEKDWAAGSSNIDTTTEWVIRGDKCALERVAYPPALVKMFDEVLVNALDRVVEWFDTTHPIKAIHIKYTPEGKIIIYNDGKGVEVAIHPVSHMWVPQFIFGVVFQGQNRTKSATSRNAIIGGTNGIGAKIANIMSTQFSVETCDGKKFYLQHWRNRMSECDPPTVIPVAEAPPAKRIQHTIISFTPDYVAKFGYSAMNDEVYATLERIFYTRVALASCYIRWFCEQVGTVAPTITFNASPVVWTLPTLVSAMSGGPVFSTCIGGPAVKRGRAAKHAHITLTDGVFPWQVVVAQKTQKAQGKCKISLVNGIVVHSGKHIKHIVDQIVDSVRDRITKFLKDKSIEFSPRCVTDNIVVFLNCMIPNPSWDGQRKDKIAISDQIDLNMYKIPASLIEDIYKQIVEIIVASIYSKTIDNNNESIRRGDMPDKVKYEPAKRLGVAKSSLVLVEGDSPAENVKIAIRETNNEYYGVMSTGGVIINVRKESSIIMTPKGRAIKKSIKLTDNKFIQALLIATGLNPQFMYDPSKPSYSSEISKLRYRQIIILTDQDLDGVGQIASLILNLAEYWFPNLLSAGYFRIFETYRYTATPKSGKKLGWTTDFEYEQWLANDPNASKYKISFIKGLASYQSKEFNSIFKAVDKFLLSVYSDRTASDAFNIYYGVDSSLRKKQLALPPPLSYEEMYTRRKSRGGIMVTDHLHFNANPFQKDNIERKIIHAVDGFTQSSRMIYNTSRIVTKGREIKVAQLSGAVSEREDYHHGEVSLENAIKGRAFVAIGGRQVPMFRPKGQFGTRQCGGDKAGAARYTFIELNRVNLRIYPEVDYNLLKFKKAGCERAEPQYFVPIIPTSILESICQPATGWQIKLFARDVFAVIDSVRLIISTYADSADNPHTLVPFVSTQWRYAEEPLWSCKQIPKLPLANVGWSGRVETHGGKQYSFGKYYYTVHDTHTMLYITELPYRVWTNNYVADIRKKVYDPIRVKPPKAGENTHAVVYDGVMFEGDPKVVVDDYSKELTIDIRIKLKPDAISRIASYATSYTDAIEEYFMLRDHMNNQINLIGSKSQVLELKNYEEAVYYWFPYRKSMYYDRIKRQLIILSINIERLTNTVRYIEHGLDLRNIPSVRQNEIIESHNYRKIVLKMSLDQVPTELLEETVYGANGDYRYLLKISDYSRSNENLSDLKKQLADTQAERDLLSGDANSGNFYGAKIWLRELDELEAELRFGMKTNWEYESFGTVTEPDE